MYDLQMTKMKSILPLAEGPESFAGELMKKGKEKYFVTLYSGNEAQYCVFESEDTVSLPLEYFYSSLNDFMVEEKTTKTLDLIQILKTPKISLAFIGGILLLLLFLIFVRVIKQHF